MSGDGSNSSSVRVDWGTPQASASTTTSAAPDASRMSKLDRVIAEYLASDDPMPQGASHEIGDGDFRAIGAEFLRYFVEFGGLSPEDHVLDIGCGFGRMALPLARYLTTDGRYYGFDIVSEPVDWCLNHVRPRHTSFSFETINLHHPLYNPHPNFPSKMGFLSHLRGINENKFTFIAAISVFTHLEHDSIIHYLADSSAVLASDGRLFMTAFLIGPSTPKHDTSGSFPRTAWQKHPPLTALLGDPLTAAVGLPRDWLDRELDTHGLKIESLIYGHWRRCPDAQSPFQDILILARK